MGSIDIFKPLSILLLRTSKNPRDKKEPLCYAAPQQQAKFYN